jgi:glyoxylase-like metal-dependent hydrolase (beta-lactamase superfamily II)
VKRIAQDVYLIEGLRMVNVYLLVSDTGLTLVDAGTSGDVKHIVAQIEGAGFNPADLRSIVVTHAHSDHTGGIPELVRRFGAQVIAHRDEVPYVEGTESLPAGNAFLRLISRMMDLAPGQNAGIEVARPVEDGEQLDVLGGLRVIHTPGHTPGSMCLYQEEREVLFSGDLLSNGNLLTGRGGVQYGPGAFSVDREQARRSVRRLAGLEIEVLCTGHGAPILEDADERIAELIG